MLLLSRIIWAFPDEIADRHSITTNNNVMPDIDCFDLNGFILFSFLNCPQSLFSRKKFLTNFLKKKEFSDRHELG